ncbi:MAG TPA: hypothetical protein VNJ01_09200 [Bacteriovoracaceae bacterium]|nr:hypothetical protein [Bacteriovoracaceae bacterium]
MELKETNRKLTQLFGFIVIAALIGGCSSRGKSIGFGGALGAGMGAALGGIVDPGKNGQYRTRNVIVGATVGAIAGGFTGMSLHEQKDQEKELARLKEKAKSDSRAPTPPSLEQPKVEAHWVESKAVGNRWVEGHYEYVITEPTRWTNP